jgi:hypothetical protein
MKWLLLILSLPTTNTAARMRAWRTLKASGAAVLRDGVYLLPSTSPHEEVFAGVSQDVIANEGSAHVFATESSEPGKLAMLFDRQEDYAALQADLQQLAARIAESDLQDAFKQLRKLRKQFANLATIDFFPNDSQSQTQQTLQALEVQLNRQLSPNEPETVDGSISARDITDYQQRRWATRKRPWVDRLACAWLIRRFIDPHAQFLWLESLDQCPTDALGFDFDGAEFTHIGNRVSFEVLLASFGLHQPELLRLGVLVHYLDAGGVQPLEASGLEQILWGLRNSIANDDQLLAAAESVFDALLAAFVHKEKI